MQEWGSWRAARRRRFRRRMRLSARRRRTARRRVAFHCAGVIAVSREVSLCPVPFWCCGNNAFRQIWKRHATPCASSPRAFSCRLSGSRTAYGPMSVSTSGGAMRRQRLQKTGRRREYSPPSRAADALLPQGLFPLKRSIFWAYYRPGRRYLNRRSLPSSPWRRLLAGFVNFRRLIKPVGQNHRRCAKSVKSAGVPRASATFCRRAFLIFRVLRA